MLCVLINMWFVVESKSRNVTAENAGMGIGMFIFKYFFLFEHQCLKNQC